jgi:hypothetical protein
MSREQRQKDIWPANLFARYLWLISGLWDDIHALAAAYKSAPDHNVQVVIARHLLVDFDSLDELIKEFHEYVKDEAVPRLHTGDGELLKQAFTDYHRAFEPFRPKLKKIRNTFGAHRTGKPKEKAKKYWATDRNAWGEWEQFLVELEGYCDLLQWAEAFNAVVNLINIVKDVNLDEWFSVPSEGIFRYYSPLYGAEYYPSTKMD